MYVLLRLAQLVALAVVFAAAVPARAQPAVTGADSLAWELVGQTFEAYGLFATGVAADGTGDLPPAVYANGTDGLFVIRPGEKSWTLIADYPTLRASDDAFVSREGTLFGIGRFGIYRSPDGGESWVETIDGAYLAPAYTPAGALVTNLDGDVENTLARSTDDGLTWTLIDTLPTLGTRFLPLAFAALPVSDDLPGGRLVAGGNDGLVYSDDDGLSWHPTNVFAGFAFRATSVDRAPWGGVPGDSERGTLYAQVNDFAEGDIGGVWESSDGVAWERVGQVPAANDTGAQIVAAGDSTLYAINFNENEDVQVYRSEDRGRTWAPTGRIPAEEAVGNPVEMQELVVGPEGRLWLGMKQGTGGPGLTGGVFRTMEPVVAVSAEGGPEEGAGEAGAELEVYPNPSTGRATVAVWLPEAEAVRVEVVDVVGRAVAVLHEGPLAAGRHEMSFDGSGLPSGLYVVRVTGRGSEIGRRITVVR